MRSRERILGAAAAGLVALALVPALAAACGVCVEDRMAAVYDHAVESAALARGHAVAYLAITGVRGARAAPEAARRVARALRGCPGVDPGSARVSGEAAAAALAFDPARTSLAALLARLDRRLAPWSLVLDTLRVRRPPPSSAARGAHDVPTPSSLDRQVAHATSR